jgi:hypothetical protein
MAARLSNKFQYTAIQPVKPPPPPELSEAELYLRREAEEMAKCREQDASLLRKVKLDGSPDNRS